MPTVSDASPAPRSAFAEGESWLLVRQNDMEAVVERFKQLDAARKDAEHARQELCEAEASADAAGATDAANGCGRGGKRRGGAQEAPAERGKRARR